MTRLLYVALICAYLLATGAAWLSAWRNAALKHDLEMAEARAAETARELTAVRYGSDAAKSETAMCRRAIEHADRAVENLENALKEARSKP